MKHRRNRTELRSINIRIGDLSTHFNLKLECLVFRSESIERAFSLRDTATAFLHRKDESQRQNPNPNPNPNPSPSPSPNPDLATSMNCSEVRSRDCYNDPEELIDSSLHTDGAFEEFWIDWTSVDSEFFGIYPFLSWDGARNESQVW
jgi:hypothetical protein